MAVPWVRAASCQSGTSESAPPPLTRKSCISIKQIFEISLFSICWNRNIPACECDLDIISHSSTQEDESQRSFLFVLSLHVLAHYDHQSTDYFSVSFHLCFHSFPLIPLGEAERFRSALLSYFRLASWSLTYLDAEHHRGVAYSTGHPRESH